MERKIIIDTDPGKDDALAIFLMARSNMFKIKAITTVAGNSIVQNTTNNARYLVDLLKIDIPLYSGEEKPLRQKLITANVHGTNGLEGANITKQEKLTKNAYKKIIEIVRENPGEISILAIGPLTNIAKAFSKDPELPSLIDEIVIMGGAFDVPGNKSRVSEFNIFVDPDAAKIVFESGAKITLVPLDVCNITPMFMDDFKKIKGSLREPVLKMMANYIKAIEKFENLEGALVYDALAGYYLINKSAFKTEMSDIKIETNGEFTKGMTVIERRGRMPKKLNVNLVTKIDRNKFVRDFVKYLSD